jgi:XTP/dITP diphosphohydrolase
MTTYRILIATHNAGKLREYQELLANLPIELVTLESLAITEAPGETGKSFEENARLKARAYARASGLMTLADDSGLEVDALNGAPGIHSARYGGDAAPDDEARYRLLLSNLEGVPNPARAARFRCVVALATPQGDIHTAEARCEGHIGHEPMGEHGFGYDPVFIVAERGVTMAQLPPDEKNRISHRAKALQTIRPILAHLLETYQASTGSNDFEEV